MADDIRITITGDIDDLRKEYKKLDKLVNRFDKVNKRSTQRREKLAKESSKNIQRITAAEVKKNLASHRRKNAMLARDNKQREREAIRSEKRIARERERVLKRHAARRRRIMRGISRFGMRSLGLLGLGGGIGVVYKAREILKFDVALARAAAQADVSRESQFKLRDAINKTSLESGVQRDVLMEMVGTIVDLSGDIDLASRGLGTFAKIIRGTGTDARELGRFAVSLKAAFGDITETELFDKMEILIAQGDKAKVNIAALASEGEKLFGAFRGKGFKGEKSFREFGAFIQLAARSGDVSEGSTAVTRFVSSLIKQQKQLSGAGIEVFTGKGNQKRIRDFGDILKDILKSTQGDVTKLNKLFPNIRALKAIELLGIEYKEAGGEIKEFEELAAVAADTIDRKFKRVAETTSQGFERMAAGITLFADTALVDVLNDMADAMKRFFDDPSGMKQLEDTARVIGDTLRAAWDVSSMGAKGIGFVFGRAKEMREKFEPSAMEHHRFAEKEKRRFWGTQTGTPVKDIGKSIEEMSFKVINNITVDYTGKEIFSEAKLLTQASNDRGQRAEYVTREEP